MVSRWRVWSRASSISEQHGIVGWKEEPGSCTDLWVSKCFGKPRFTYWFSTLGRIRVSTFPTPTHY
jgi:hypothetical protein